MPIFPTGALIATSSVSP
ncbi:hypothetical protein LINPERPRIM_LOCUS32924 [Linum perenne]